MAPRRSRLRPRPAAPAHAGDAAGGGEAVGHEADGHEPELDLERVVFFSDAVFAIAITLLVLDLRIPDLPDHASQDTIRAALVAATPRIFAWILSFATIGLYSIAHWRKFRAIERTDERLAAINLLLLGVIAFVPFPTGLIGAHGDEPLVVVLYALTLATAGILGSVSWIYARWAGLTRPRDRRSVRAARRIPRHHGPDRDARLAGVAAVRVNVRRRGVVAPDLPGPDRDQPTPQPVDATVRRRTDWSRATDELEPGDLGLVADLVDPLDAARHLDDRIGILDPLDLAADDRSRADHRDLEPIGERGRRRIRSELLADPGIDVGLTVDPRAAGRIDPIGVVGRHERRIARRDPGLALLDRNERIVRLAGAQVGRRGDAPFLLGQRQLALALDLVRLDDGVLIDRQRLALELGDLGLEWFVTDGRTVVGERAWIRHVRMVTGLASDREHGTGRGRHRRVTVQPSERRPHRYRRPMATDGRAATSPSGSASTSGRSSRTYDPRDARTTRRRTTATRSSASSDMDDAIRRAVRAELVDVNRA